jgi:hypothetical protein
MFKGFFAFCGFVAELVGKIAGIGRALVNALGEFRLDCRGARLSERRFAGSSL